MKSNELFQESLRGADDEFAYLKARDELDEYIKATFTPSNLKRDDDTRHYRNEDYESVERENNKPSWDY